LGPGSDSRGRRAVPGSEAPDTHRLKTGATVIPCIDVMGGKVVQLVKGEKKTLELESADEAVEMFRGFPLLHIIDLDAAKGTGHNRELIGEILGKVRARVGGGVRSVADAKALVEMGAEQVIVGTAAFSGRSWPPERDPPRRDSSPMDRGRLPALPEREGKESGNDIRSDFLRGLCAAIGRERVVVAIDVKNGRIAVKGWQATLDLAPADVLAELEPYCAGFQCTYVDREGMMEGTNLDFFLDLRKRTNSLLVAAGGISSMDEVRTLTDAGIEVALGMAVYMGKLSLTELAELAKPR